MTKQQRDRFCGGRAAWIARRRLAAEKRRVQVVRLFVDSDVSVRGWRKKIADQLGVHSATIGRDLKIIAAQQNQHQLDRFENELHFRQRFLRQIENVNARHETQQLQKTFTNNHTE